jgi:hypothetical protein
VTLEDLHTVSPSVAALLVETCGGRRALAAHLVDEISSAVAMAAARATEVERERCLAHAMLAPLSNLNLVIAAIRSGASIRDVSADYLAAAKARATTPLTLAKGGTTP